MAHLSTVLRIRAKTYEFFGNALIPSKTVLKHQKLPAKTAVFTKWALLRLTNTCDRMGDCNFSGLMIFNKIFI